MSQRKYFVILERIKGLRKVNRESVLLRYIIANFFDNGNKWLKKAEEVLDFARDAKEAFENGDAFKKKEIFSKLGSNLLLKDKIVKIDMENALIPLKDVVIENKRLEPLKIGIDTTEIEQIYAQSPRMLYSSVWNPYPVGSIRVF